MKVAIYGLPRSGKDYLINMAVVNGFFEHFRGSSFLNERAGGDFRSLSESEKKQIRKELIEHVSKMDGDIIIDGHYMFPDEDGGYDVVFTNDDGNCYDFFIYLDTSVDVILERMKDSEKNERYANLSRDEIKDWKEKEINGLKKECFRRNKEFVVFDEDMNARLEFLRLIKEQPKNMHSYEIAREIAESILEHTDGIKKICLLDCDKTISINDPTLDFAEISGLDFSKIVEIFNNRRYSRYQFWKVSNLYFQISDYNIICNESAKKILLNRPLIEDISCRDDVIAVGITSGLFNVWKEVQKIHGFPDMVFGGSNLSIDEYVLSDMTKGYVAAILRKLGKTVISAGDSMTDILMLENSDTAFAISAGTRSRSLNAYLSDGHSEIKQPQYNSILFDNVTVEASIL